MTMTRKACGYLAGKQLQRLRESPTLAILFRCALVLTRMRARCQIDASVSRNGDGRDLLQSAIGLPLPGRCCCLGTNCWRLRCG